MPDLDPEIRDMLKWSPSASEASCQALPIGPLRWVNRKDGTGIAVAVGTVDRKQRKKEIATFTR